jgi:2-polyprenyl-3-methyl-5-hydroxy-6-metoxy-1,4-benzoquinol methylase
VKMLGPSYEFKAFRYSSHYWILKMLELEKQPVRILDVGTADGYLGKILSDRGHSVAGIESDAATANRAKAYYDSFHIADLEAFEFPYRREFDYILFGDILEHLRDPADVLRKCLPTLRESGRIIISVPNVANVFVRLSLLLGRFEYMGRGILDRTHLRFFTHRSLLRMLSEVPCRVLRVVATPLPLQIVWPFTDKKFFSPLHRALYMLTRSWKAGLAYQFVVEAAPARNQFSTDRSHNASELVGKDWA